MKRYLDDVLILLGCALILVGVWKINQVATWFVGGGMLIVFGIILAISRRGQ